MRPPRLRGKCGPKDHAAACKTNTQPEMSFAHDQILSCITACPRGVTLTGCNLFPQIRLRPLFRTFIFRDWKMNTGLRRVLFTRSPWTRETTARTKYPKAPLTLPGISLP